MATKIYKGIEGGNQATPFTTSAMMPPMPATPITAPNQRDREQFVRRIDAGSRIILTAINWSDTSRIAQMGDFSHNASAEGFYSWDGKKMALPPAPQLAKLTSESLCRQLDASGPNTATIFTGQFLDALGPDPVYLARSLKLDKRDYDNLRHGKIIRSFSDNTTPLPYGYEPLPIFDHLGFFLRMDVLYCGAVFTSKCFKFKDRLGEVTFLFKPEHSGVCFGVCQGQNAEIVLTPDAAEFISSGRTYAWLNNTGDLDELDWEVFCGRRVFYLWHADGFQAKNQFSAAMHFAATARKHGVEVQIIRRTVSGDYNLALPELVKQAYTYGLRVPAELRNQKHVLAGNNVAEFIPAGIPFFWQNGRCTLFCGNGQKALLFNLYRAIAWGSHGFRRRNIAFIFPERAKMRTCKLSRKLLGAPLLIDAGMLQDAGEFETAVYQNGIEVIFIVFAGDFSRKELTAVWERCEEMQLIIGIFAEEDDFPESVDEALVDQRFLTVGSDVTILAKNTQTKSIEKYSFNGDGTLSTSPGSEDKFYKAKEKKYGNLD